jgi:hypothetical protein
MRKLLLIAIATITVALGVALLRRGDKIFSPPKTTDADATTARPDGAPPTKAKARATSMLKQRPTSIVPYEPLREDTSVRLSSTDRRPREDEADYQKRLRQRAKYLEFVQRAGLTADQESRVRRVFADAQENHRRIQHDFLEAYNEQVMADTGNHPTPANLAAAQEANKERGADLVKQMLNIVEDEVQTSLRSMLNEKQMKLYEGMYGYLGPSLGFGPFDIDGIDVSP